MMGLNVFQEADELVLFQDERYRRTIVDHDYCLSIFVGLCPVGSSIDEGALGEVDVCQNLLLGGSRLPSKIQVKRN